MLHHHIKKEHFSVLTLSVVVLEIAAYILFLIGITTAFYGIMYEHPTTVVITAGFGGILGAFILMATGEMIQLLMKIEYNTRKEASLISRAISRKRK